MTDLLRNRDVTPPGTRLIRASIDLLATWGTRSERGDRITAEWGEPDEWGVYEPTFTEHRDHTAEVREAVVEAARKWRDARVPGSFLALVVREPDAPKPGCCAVCGEFILPGHLNTLIHREARAGAEGALHASMMGTQMLLDAMSQIAALREALADLADESRGVAFDDALLAALSTLASTAQAAQDYEARIRADAVKPWREALTLARGMALNGAAGQHLNGAGIMQDPPHDGKFAECRAPWCVRNQGRLAEIDRLLDVDKASERER
jgi:hypothetical protein